MKRYEVILDIDDDTDWITEGFSRETWYNQDGLIDRPNGPARIVMNQLDEKLPMKHEWYVDGVRHRDDGPAVVKYNLHGDVQREEWFHKGRLHRVDGPAIYEVDESHNIVVLSAWYVDGKLHRTDGPAEIHRDFETGVPYIETWAVNGQRHRIGEPACISRDNDTGEITWAQYYENGVRIENRNQLIPQI